MMADNNLASRCPYCAPGSDVKLAQRTPDESRIELTLVGMLKSTLQASVIADDGIACAKEYFPIHFCPMRGRRVGL